MEPTVTLGSYLRDRRVESGLSLRDVAIKVGVSHVFWGEVERGRKSLPRERWAAVASAVPAVELKVMAELASTDAKVQMSLRAAGPKYEHLGQLLLRRAKKQDISDERFVTLMRLLTGDDE